MSIMVQGEKSRMVLGMVVYIELKKKNFGKGGHYKSGCPAWKESGRGKRKREKSITLIINLKRRNWKTY